MTRNEAKGVVEMLSKTYPNFKPGNDLDEIKKTVDAWFFFLEDYELADVLISMKAFSKSGQGKGFAPTVDQLINQIHKMRESQNEELNEVQAWNLVSNAIRKSNYYAEEEFEKLGKYPAIQKAVGSPSMLRNWATTDINTLENVVASNFQRSYRATVIREKEIERMPKGITQGIEMIMNNLLEVKNDNRM